MMLKQGNSSRWLAVLSLGAMLLTAGQALAYSPENELMKVKGYSPEVIELADAQRSRQEWKEAAPPKHTPVEKFMHNVYYGDWTGSVDPFGSEVIRNH